MTTVTYDYRATNHGSLWLLTPVSPEAEDWIETHVGGEDTLTFGRGVVVEPRYIGPILDALDEAGFVRG